MSKHQLIDIILTTSDGDPREDLIPTAHTLDLFRQHLLKHIPTADPCEHHHIVNIFDFAFHHTLKRTIMPNIDTHHYEWLRQYNLLAGVIIEQVLARYGNTDEHKERYRSDQEMCKEEMEKITDKMMDDRKKMKSKR